MARVPDAGRMAYGTVTLSRPSGWGAITSPELSGGHDAFVHFSAIEMAGFRVLETGDEVEFDYHAAQQDSFRFAVRAPNAVPSPWHRWFTKPRHPGSGC